MRTVDDIWSEISNLEDDISILEQEYEDSIRVTAYDEFDGYPSRPIYEGDKTIQSKINALKSKMGALYDEIKKMEDAA